jgi:sugar lactone lactonase YvrE
MAPSPAHRPRLEPVVWRAPAPPPRARRPQSDPPIPVPRLLPAGGRGPEDTLVDDRGRVLTGLADGRVQRVDPAGGAVRTLAVTGGRPLGLEWLPDGRLLICDAERGLLRLDVDRSGADPAGAAAGPGDLVEPEQLLGPAGISLANNAAVAADGTIYVSDSSRRFGLGDYLVDLFEHSGTGRLLRRDPDGAVEALLDGLQFANGVALAPDESFVLVAETGGYRVLRYWLAGPRAGDHEVFADVPGFPDNLSTGPGGTFWVALPTRRDRRMDLLHRSPGALRRAVVALPQRLQPPPAKTTWVLGLDGDGRVVRDLQGSTPGWWMATGVREHDGRLYLGSLETETVAEVTL